MKKIFLLIFVCIFICIMLSGGCHPTSYYSNKVFINGSTYKYDNEQIETGLFSCKVKSNNNDIVNVKVYSGATGRSWIVKESDDIEVISKNEKSLLNFSLIPSIGSSNSLEKFTIKIKNYPATIEMKQIFALEGYEEKSYNELEAFSTITLEVEK